jgi:AraC-like DNA-binding protein
MATTQLQHLARIVERHADTDGEHFAAIPELALYRSSAPSEHTATVYQPCLCVMVQGAKEIVVGDHSYRYDESNSLLVSVDLPATSRVTDATPDRPSLAVRIAIDPAMVGDLLAEGTKVAPTAPSERAVAICKMDAKLLDAVVRLVALLDSPDDIGPLAPLILREVIHRVLTGPQGLRLRQIALAGAPAYRIAKAIRWVKDHFADPLHVATLAKDVGLSTSAFHLHFKNVTALSPLQYQKRLRLQEARRLMLSKRLDAADAAFQVGYESPSQFSREYRRMYGAPPRRDVAAIKEEASFEPQSQSLPKVLGLR